MKHILNDAAKNNYAVIAANALNMEMARGAISAANFAKAPLIVILGGNQMARHANGELMMSLIKTLADAASVPVALCLDHGKDFSKVAYCLRHGFSSIMVDASTYEIQENITLTKRVVEICHPLDIGVEGELGHVGFAANLDGCDEALYTRPEDAAYFAAKTNVDCLAIAVGTAHGKYPKGFIPCINFDLIRRVKKSTNRMPIALHGSSGSGDDNILRAVEAGINKINVATEIQLACRNAVAKRLKQEPDTDLIDLLQVMETAAYDMVSHWIRLSGSQGKATGIKPVTSYDRLVSIDGVYNRFEE
jgi:fructose-bisphosphate aldolase class II